MKHPIAVIAVLLVAGCADLKEAGTDMHARFVGWLHPAEAPAIPLDSLYCYRTLADEDCYAYPIAGEERRLIGYVGPAPQPR
jgi:hypothetical protein